MNNDIKVSIVIGFRNWGLDRVVGAVRSIKLSAQNTANEVIVADYGSENSSGYKEAIESVGGRYFYFKTDDVWSRSIALNCGLRLARGEFLITTDADMVFSPGAIDKIVSTAENNLNSIVLLQCRDLPEGISHHDINSGSLSWDQIELRSRLRPRWGMGGMLAMHKQAYFQLRGLDERMKIYGGEDIDLVNRLTKSGYRQIWITDPSVKMYHVWHPSSRVSATSTEEGEVAVKDNRRITQTDNSLIRNLRNWIGRPPQVRPLVTVAIATRNRAEFLRESILSVLGQTFQDFEIIVVDDGSTDNTVEVLESFEDDRLRFFSIENQGIPVARNLITREARGTYIAIHDDDDIMLPIRLEYGLQALTAGVNASYGGWINFDNKSGNLDYQEGKRVSAESVLFNARTYVHATLIVRKSILEAIPYDESMRSGSDFNLACRLLRSGIEFQHCGHYVMLRRLHDTQVTSADSDVQKDSAIVSSYYARSRMLGADIKIAKQDRANKDALDLTVQGKDLPRTVAFLPDHLVDRSVNIRADTVNYQSICALLGDPSVGKLELSSGVSYFFWRERGIDLSRAFSLISMDGIDLDWDVDFHSKGPSSLGSSEDSVLISAEPTIVDESVSICTRFLSDLDPTIHLFVLYQGYIDTAVYVTDPTMRFIVADRSEEDDFSSLSILVYRVETFSRALDVIRNVDSLEDCIVYSTRILDTTRGKK